MKITYKSESYRSSNVDKRYVRFDGKRFRFCETDKVTGFDVMQGAVYRSEIPEHVAKQAMRQHGSFPSYVEWPWF